MNGYCQPVTRRKFAAALFFGTLAGAIGADGTRKLGMRVKAQAFGAGEADIKAVLRSAAGEIWKHCPNTKFEQPGFDIYRNEKYPITHFERSDDGWIVIGLATEKMFWAQYSYQFAHEFCHAIADHSDDWRRIWRAGGHANKWLEESLCETASLFSLRAMGRTWQTEPPYPNWKSYAPALTRYAQERMDDPKSRVPEGRSFLEWFRENEPEMRKNGTDRPRNNVVSLQLLPLFEAEPSGWEAMSAINLGKRDPKKPLAQHFAEWKENTRAELRPFVAKIAAVFGL